jgi:colanic acid biosynthesis protein WcaH
MDISEKDLLDIIKLTPLISIDLIIKDQKRRILMGKRINNPAANSWFVPGGRIKKGTRCSMFQFSEVEIDNV